jgi:hypothetical protein
MRYQVGDRVTLVSMGADIDPIPSGSEGTVTHVTELQFAGEDQLQVGVKWDNGRSLSCLVPPDVLVRTDPYAP